MRGFLGLFLFLLLVGGGVYMILVIKKLSVDSLCGKRSASWP